MNAAGVSRAFPAAVLVEALALAGAAGLVLLALGSTSQEVPPATRLLAAIAAPALLAPLFCGQQTPATLAAITAHVVSWALGTVLLVMVLALAGGALPLAGIPAPALVAGGIVVTSLLAMQVAARVLRSFGMDAATAESSARWLVVAALWLLAAAPLWLGPYADLVARAGPARASAIVALSPLLHLGVAAGQDLLRTEWFYQHASFGSLQFDYPSLAAIAQAYLAIAVALAALDRALARLAMPPTQLPQPLPTQESAR